MNREFSSRDVRKNKMETYGQLCDDLKHIDLSQIQLSELVQYMHTIRNVFTVSEEESSYIQSQLEQQQKIINMNNDHAHKVVEVVGGCNTKIKELNNDIEKLDKQIVALFNQREARCKQKEEYLQCINHININLVDVFFKQNELRQNVTENRNQLVKIERYRTICNEFKQKLLHQCEAIPFNSWDKKNFMHWIICISNGDFDDNKYKPFFTAVQSTQFIIKDITMTEEVLRKLGLKDSEDINMIIKNWRRMMKNQSERKKEKVAP